MKMIPTCPKDDKPLISIGFHHWACDCGYRQYGDRQNNNPAWKVKK